MTKSGGRVITVVFALAGTYAVASGQPIENWPVPQLWIPALAVASGEADKALSPLEADAVEGVPTPSVPFVGIAPCRILDTRGNGAQIQGGIFTDGQARNYTLTGICGIPAGAQAASLNFTVTGSPSAPPGAFLLAYPQGGAVPPVSILNFQAGQTLANAAIVPLSGAGAITVNVSHSTHVIIDVNGYFGGTVVSALNGLTGNVTLAAGSNVTITPSGQTLTIASTGGPGGLLPVGSVNQTLRHNGTSWVASSALTNNGTDVGLTGTLALPSSVLMTAGGSRFLHNG